MSQTYNFTHNLLSITKLTTTMANLQTLALVILTTFFLLETGYSRPDPVSFTFTTPQLGMNSGPQLGMNSGRALYSKPVPIWDTTTGLVASFVTSFSFIVQDVTGFPPADRLVFFLAPLDTDIPSGGILALDQFVGVEFDSHINDLDSSSAHIGINVNSLISLKSVTWNRISGSLVKVNIIYDASSKTLSVAVTNEDGKISTVAQVVDLKAVLPEKVRIGLATTTTHGARQKHHIQSWSFTSNSILDIFENKNNIASYA